MTLKRQKTNIVLMINAGKANSTLPVASQERQFNMAVGEGFVYLRLGHLQRHVFKTDWSKNESLLNYFLFCAVKTTFSFTL